MMDKINQILRLLPRSIRAVFWRIFYRLTLASPVRSDDGVSVGSKVVVAGMFRTASGLGAWARSNYYALQEAGFDVIAVDLSERLAPVDFDCKIPLQTFPPDRSGTLLIHVNAPEIAASLRLIGLRRGRKWRVIAAWAWELDFFPIGWERAYSYISEIWALSDFAAAAFRKHVRSPPVRVAPIAVSLPSHLELKKPEKKVFRVLVLADALSSLERKNPIGSVEAFKIAFEGRDDCRLIVKIRNLKNAGTNASALRAQIDELSNAELLEGTLTDEQQWQLIASVDILLSLHRAEGFGLGLAEAMVVGVPVIATAWSGNLMFCNQDTAALVPYSLVKTSDSSGQYTWEGAFWAEPDIAAASNLLRVLEANRDRGSALAKSAGEMIRRVCGPKRIQKLTTDYLRKPPYE